MMISRNQRKNGAEKTKILKNSGFNSGSEEVLVHGRIHGL